MTSVPRSLGWLTRLVALDTTSHLPNLDLIDLVAGECRRLALTPHVFPSPDGTKANLVVTVPDSNGGTTGGVLLSGHTDVVPVTGQAWTGDPFTLRQQDGKLIGRGVADMKGYLAVCVEALERFAAARLREPLHLTLTYDEEPGCIGGAALMGQIASLGIRPSMALIGEPTSMEVVSFHKSSNRVRVRFTGAEAHSSLTPRGVNAVEYAAEMVVFLRGIADRWRTQGPFDEGYVVPYSTLSVNTIAGGTAGNIIAGACELTVDYRTIEQDDPQQVLAEVRAKAAGLSARMAQVRPGAGAEVEVLAQAPGLANHGSAAAALATVIGAAPDGPKVAYGTEAGQFHQAGIDAIVCGPGDIAQAHTADEWITLDQILTAERYLDALLTRMTTGT